MNKRFGLQVTDFIRIFRLDRKEMAVICGVSVSTIINWETGRTHPRDVLIEKGIAGVFDFINSNGLAKGLTLLGLPNSALNGLTAKEYLYKAGIKELANKLHTL